MLDYEKLKELMWEKGYGCTSFADAVGITQAHMCNITNGKSVNLRLSTLDRICKVLECSPGEILK